MSLGQPAFSEKFIPFFMIAFILFLILLFQLNPQGQYALSFRDSSLGHKSSTSPVIQALQANPNPAVPNQSIEFTVIAVDARTESDDLMYRWDFGDGSSQLLQGQNEIQHTYTFAGEFLARVQVTNSRGVSKIGSLTVFVTAHSSESSSLVSSEEPSSSTSDSDSLSTSGTLPLDLDNSLSSKPSSNPLDDFPSNPVQSFVCGDTICQTDLEENSTNCPQDCISSQEPKPEEPLKDSMPSKSNQAPQITSFTLSTSSVTEGQPVTFTATATDVDSNILTFLWDFGDSQIISTSENQVIHTFALKSMTDPVSVFHTKVTVTDGNLFDSAYADLNVTRAFLLVDVIEPILDVTQKHSKTNPVTISLRVLDYQFQPALNAIVRARVNQSLLILNSSDLGIFTGSFTPTYATPNLAYLIVDANAVIAQSQRFAQSYSLLLFSPVSLTALNPFEQQSFFPGDVIQDIRLHLIYPDGTPVQGAVLNGSFKTSNQSLQLEFQEELDQYIAPFEYQLGLQDTNVFIEVHARDPFGNTLPLTIFPIQLLSDNPQFNVQLRFPTSSTLVGPNESIRVVAHVESAQQSSLEDVRLFVRIPEINSLIELKRDANSGEFETTLNLPERSPNSLTFEIIGSARSQETLLLDRTQSNVMVSPELSLKFIYPADGSTPLDFEHSNRLRVHASYANGSEVSVPNLLATLAWDKGANESYSLNLQLDANTGNYFADLPEPFTEGEHKLTLQLTETFSGTKTITTRLFNPFVLQVLVIGLFVLFVLLYFGYVYRRDRAREHQKMVMHKDELQGLLKTLPIEFYKRHISEKEFKDKLLHTQEELRVVSKKLEKL